MECNRTENRGLKALRHNADDVICSMNSVSCDANTTDYHLHTVCMTIVVIKDSENKETTFTVQNVKHLQKSTLCQHTIKPQQPW